MSKKFLRLKNYLENNTGKRLFHMYLIFAVVFLAFDLLFGVFNLVYTSGRRNVPLTLNDFEPVAAEYVNDMQMINRSDDTQLLYTGKVRNLYVKCRFTMSPGEFVAYYSKDEENNWRAANPVYAKKKGDYYIFRFPVGTEKIRLDTGVEPHITVYFDEITLNKRNIREVFGFSALGIFLLFLTPPLALIILYTALLFLTPKAVTGTQAKRKTGNNGKIIYSRTRREKE